MNITARITGVWKKRMLMIFAFVIGIGLWFFYDAFIGWPAEAKRYEQYETFKNQLVEQGRSREEVNAPHNKAIEEQWRDYAREHGFGSGIPSRRTEADFAAQKKYGGLMVLLSLGILGWYFISCARELRSDDTTIYFPNGKQATFESVLSIDRKRWEKKGIAVALYRTPEGKMMKGILDDYKYGGAEKILLEIEQRLIAKNTPHH